METELKRNYEIAFLIRNEGAISEVLSLLKQHGAEIEFEGSLKKIALAYLIQGEAQAYFGYFHFRLRPEDFSLLEHSLRAAPSVLRFLIIIIPFVKNMSAVRPRKEVIPMERPSREPILAKPASPLSNEELEKKIDEILR